MTITAKSTDRMAGSFARAAKSLVASGNIDEALRRARYDGASESALALLQQKAASPAASLGDAEWAANVANQGGASVDFIESLRPSSLFFRFTQRAQNFPLYQSLTAFAALETGGEIAEAAWVPVVAGSTEQTELLPRKTGGVVVMSPRTGRRHRPGILRRVPARAAARSRGERGRYLSRHPGRRNQREPD
jgi:hypothetical protein